MRTLVFAMLLITAALGQGPPFPAPPPADGPKQPVSGRVINAETGQPVRGAKVALMQGPGALSSTVSDSAGRFRIEEAPAGEWSVSIMKSGYARLMERISVPTSQPLTDVELRVHRNAVITGRVLDHLGRPVTDANIAVLAPRFEGGAFVLRPASSGMNGRGTDDRGEYRVWNLSPGPHVVGVYPKPSPGAAGKLRFQSTGSFYPAGASLAEADRVHIEWGQVREGVDLRVGPPAETRAVIQAVLPDGRQGDCETCSVQILPGDADAPFPIGGAGLGPGNLLVVEGLPPGRYVAGGRGFERSTNSRWYGLTSFEIAERESDPVVLALSGPATVRGRLVLEGRPAEQEGTPLQTGLRAMPPMRNMQLGMLDPRGMMVQMQVEGTEAPFEMSVVPGEVELQLLSRDRSYLAGITLDGKPLESPKLQIPPQGIPDGLVVRVGFAMGTVEGKLGDERPLNGTNAADPGYTVIARPVDPERSFNRMRYLRVLPSGAFREELSPGTYEIFASPSTPGMPPMSEPLSEAEMRKLTRRIEVKAGETVQVTLPVASEP